MTRIIAGRHKGRRLDVPPGKDIRPTTDRMRERVFSMLMHRRYPDMAGARVADLFAGTGALGLEALSRGAAHITFVEQAPASLQCLKANIATLHAEAETTVLRANAGALPTSKDAHDFIFMDPPYRMGLVRPALDAILRGGWLAEDGAIICELARDDDTDFPEALELVDERQQGQQRIVFLKKRTDAEG
ncbi:16S rRNA (guanine(966)-N(2))-methyltransferase RsmD [Kordiimonas marina]|uniref:16S rRNA (guanine(966)-N(2))-methyltransferase RsmD n=1 Tax=Kordiimonas marina TaxID=2872312 RepID=UPI001FF26444|nr:16S rRNA (guanine(966)-N(2))-methyltransferase RsmD [Kordiimonas marina]MCJ9428472.1 16S rRNA (guanine(966)-N(2))-methyltransferase RsmD [Kordiimonas marina]